MTIAPDQTGATSITLGSNTPGLVAIILAGVGFLLAVLPPTSGLAWLILIPALVFGIVGLTRKGRKKGTSIAAVIIAPIGWLISIVVFVVSLALGNSAFQEGFNDPQGALGEDTTTGQVDEPNVPGVGDTVTSSDGVSFTVNAISCGLAGAGEGFLEEKAKGEFCEVKFTLLNGTDDALNASSYDITAAIGPAEYETSSIANTFGGDSFGTDINPGLSAECVVYFDVPAGVALDTVTYSGLLSFDTPLVVEAK